MQQRTSPEWQDSDQDVSRQLIKQKTQISTPELVQYKPLMIDEQMQTNNRIYDSPQNLITNQQNIKIHENGSISKHKNTPNNTLTIRNNRTIENNQQEDNNPSIRKDLSSLVIAQQKSKQLLNHNSKKNSMIWIKESQVVRIPKSLRRPETNMDIHNEYKNISKSQNFQAQNNIRQSNSDEDFSKTRFKEQDFNSDQAKEQNKKKMKGNNIENGERAFVSINSQNQDKKVRNVQQPKQNSNSLVKQSDQQINQSQRDQISQQFKPSNQNQINQSNNSFKLEPNLNRNRQKSAGSFRESPREVKLSSLNDIFDNKDKNHDEIFIESFQQQSLYRQQIKNREEILSYNIQSPKLISFRQKNDQIKKYSDRNSNRTSKTSILEQSENGLDICKKGVEIKPYQVKGQKQGQQILSSFEQKNSKIVKDQYQSKQNIPGVKMTDFKIVEFHEEDDSSSKTLSDHREANPSKQLIKNGIKLDIPKQKKQQPKQHIHQNVPYKSKQQIDAPKHLKKEKELALKTQLSQKRSENQSEKIAIKSNQNKQQSDKFPSLTVGDLPHSAPSEPDQPKQDQQLLVQIQEQKRESIFMARTATETTFYNQFQENIQKSKQNKINVSINSEFQQKKSSNGFQETQKVSTMSYEVSPILEIASDQQRPGLRPQVLAGSQPEISQNLLNDPSIQVILQQLNQPVPKVTQTPIIIVLTSDQYKYSKKPNKIKDQKQIEIDNQIFSSRAQGNNNDSVINEIDLIDNQEPSAIDYQGDRSRDLGSDIELTFTQKISTKNYSLEQSKQQDDRFLIIGKENNIEILQDNSKEQYEKILGQLQEQYDLKDENNPIVYKTLDSNNSQSLKQNQLLEHGYETNKDSKNHQKWNNNIQNEIIQELGSLEEGSVEVDKQDASNQGSQFLHIQITDENNLNPSDQRQSNKNSRKANLSLPLTIRNSGILPGLNEELSNIERRRESIPFTQKRRMLDGQKYDHWTVTDIPVFSIQANVQTKQKIIIDNPKQTPREMHYDYNQKNTSPISKKLDTSIDNSGLQDLRIFDKPASFRPLSDQLPQQISKNQAKYPNPNEINSQFSNPQNQTFDLRNVRVSERYQFQEANNKQIREQPESNQANMRLSNLKKKQLPALDYNNRHRQLKSNIQQPQTGLLGIRESGFNNGQDGDQFINKFHSIILEEKQPQGYWVNYFTLPGQQPMKVGEQFNLNKFLHDHQLQGLLSNQKKEQSQQQFLAQNGSFGIMPEPNSQKNISFNNMIIQQNKTDRMTIQRDQSNKNTIQSTEPDTQEDPFGTGGLIDINKAFMLIQLIMRTRGFRMLTDLEIQDYLASQQNIKQMHTPRELAKTVAQFKWREVMKFMEANPHVLMQLLSYIETESKEFPKKESLVSDKNVQSFQGKSFVYQNQIQKQQKWNSQSNERDNLGNNLGNRPRFTQKIIESLQKQGITQSTVKDLNHERNLYNRLADLRNPKNNQLSTYNSRRNFQPFQNNEKNFKGLYDNHQYNNLQPIDGAQRSSFQANGQSNGFQTRYNVYKNSQENKQLSVFSNMSQVNQSTSPVYNQKHQKQKINLDVHSGIQNLKAHKSMNKATQKYKQMGKKNVVASARKALNQIKPAKTQHCEYHGSSSHDRNKDNHERSTSRDLKSGKKNSSKHYSSKTNSRDKKKIISREYDNQTTNIHIQVQGKSNKQPQLPVVSYQRNNHFQLQKSASDQSMVIYMDQDPNLQSLTNQAYDHISEYKKQTEQERLNFSNFMKHDQDHQKQPEGQLLPNLNLKSNSRQKFQGDYNQLKSTVQPEINIFAENDVIEGGEIRRKPKTNQLQKRKNKQNKIEGQNTLNLTTDAYSNPQKNEVLFKSGDFQNVMQIKPLNDSGSTSTQIFAPGISQQYRPDIKIQSNMSMQRSFELEPKKPEFHEQKVESEQDMIVPISQENDNKVKTQEGFFPQSIMKANQENQNNNFSAGNQLGIQSKSTQAIQNRTQSNYLAKEQNGPFTTKRAVMFDSINKDKQDYDNESTDNKLIQIDNQGGSIFNFGVLSQEQNSRHQNPKYLVNSPYQVDLVSNEAGIVSNEAGNAYGTESRRSGMSKNTNLFDKRFDDLQKQHELLGLEQLELEKQKQKVMKDKEKIQKMINRLDRKQELEKQEDNVKRQRMILEIEKSKLREDIGELDKLKEMLENKKGDTMVGFSELAESNKEMRSLKSSDVRKHPMTFQPSKISKTLDKTHPNNISLAAVEPFSPEKSVENVNDVLDNEIQTTVYLSNDEILNKSEINQKRQRSQMGRGHNFNPSKSQGKHKPELTDQNDQFSPTRDLNFSQDAEPDLRQQQKTPYEDNFSQKFDQSVYSNQKKSSLPQVVSKKSQVTKNKKVTSPTSVENMTFISAAGLFDWAQSQLMDEVVKGRRVFRGVANEDTGVQPFNEEQILEQIQDFKQSQRVLRASPLVLQKVFERAMESLRQIMGQMNLNILFNMVQLKYQEAMEQQNADSDSSILDNTIKLLVRCKQMINARQIGYDTLNSMLEFEKLISQIRRETDTLLEDSQKGSILVKLKRNSCERLPFLLKNIIQGVKEMRDTYKLFNKIIATTSKGHQVVNVMAYKRRDLLRYVHREYDSVRLLVQVVDINMPAQAAIQNNQKDYDNSNERTVNPQSVGNAYSHEE